MGQSCLSTHKKPVLGGIEVGCEAMVLLTSREENTTSIMMMVPASMPSPNSKGRESRIRRRRRSYMREINEEEEEEEDCIRSRADFSTRRARQLSSDEQQLCDVFYSCLRLHDTRDPVLQKVGRKGPAGGIMEVVRGDDVEAAPSIEELEKELMDLFEVDEDIMAAMKGEVETRCAPQVTLDITVHEAKDLKAKTSKETSHPYCLIRVSWSEKTYKSHVLPNTLSPVWESQFSIGIPPGQDAKVTVEVWHDPEECKDVKQQINVKERLSRAASYLQSKEMKNFLGSVTVPLPKMKDPSSEQGWYNLTKSNEEEGFNQILARKNFKSNKKRGSVRLSFTISTVAKLNLIGPHWFDNFLRRAIYHHLGFPSDSLRGRRGREHRGRSTSSNGVLVNVNERDGNSTSIEQNNPSVGNLFLPWKGTLSKTKACLVEHYATTLNLTHPATVFSWWKVTSRLSVVDQTFLGFLLKLMQDYLRDGRYSAPEIEEIASSLRLYVERQTDKMKQLTTYFPVSSNVTSYSQIQGIIRNLTALENNCNTRQMKVFPSESSITQLISDSLMDFSRQWWESCLKSQGRNSHLASEEQQLVFAVSVAGEIHGFLTDVCNFYHGIFYKESNISFLKMTYTLLTKELAGRVRPLLHHIYSTAPKMRIVHPLRQIEPDKYSLEISTPAWQLYKKFEVIEEIGEYLSEEVQQQSGLQNYHHWFLGGVERWMERVFVRTKVLITKDLEKDDFETNRSGVSHSAVDIRSNFKIIKSSWQKLSWPEEVEEDKVVKSLLYNLCGLGTHFTKLVIAKLEVKHEGCTSGDLSFIPAQVCTGLNNIQYLKKEIESIPESFGMKFAEEEGGDFSIVTKTTSGMEESVSLFMDNIITKLRPVLCRSVETSCNAGSENHLVHEVLNEEFRVLRQCLDDTNLANFLLKIWNTLVDIFTVIVDKNSRKHDAEYFSSLSRVLDSCWHTFTPTDHTGIEPQSASTSEYLSLQKTLSNLKLPTESLFAKYYRERHEELMRAPSNTAKLTLRAFFEGSGNLVVVVIMARNVVEGSGKVQVVVKLVPSEWFQNTHKAKTKILRRSDEQVFDEEFQFCVGVTSPESRRGYILFQLKSHHLVQSQVIGEAVLPLDNVPLVDSHIHENIRNITLNMNMPREDYAVVKALKFRNWDRRAQLFLQRRSLRN